MLTGTRPGADQAREELADVHRDAVQTAAAPALAELQCSPATGKREDSLVFILLTLSCNCRACCCCPMLANSNEGCSLMPLVPEGDVCLHSDSFRRKMTNGSWSLQPKRRLVKIYSTLTKLHPAFQRSLRQEKVAELLQRSVAAP